MTKWKNKNGVPFLSTVNAAIPYRQCPRTGKIQMLSRKEAEARLAEWRERDPKGSRQMKLYVCPHCEYWHFGHKKPR
jgi:hypothetical protein